jgi:hypothetical protein
MDHAMIEYIEDLYYYDGPLLFTAKDETGQLYLANCFEEDPTDFCRVYSVIKVTQFDLDTLGDPFSIHEHHRHLSPTNLRLLYLRENKRQWWTCKLDQAEIKLIPQTVPMTEDQMPGRS